MLLFNKPCKHEYDLLDFLHENVKESIRIEHGLFIIRIKLSKLAPSQYMRDYTLS